MEPLHLRNCFTLFQQNRDSSVAGEELSHLSHGISSEEESSSSDPLARNVVHYVVDQEIADQHRQAKEKSSGRWGWWTSAPKSSRGSSLDKSVLSQDPYADHEEESDPYALSDGAFQQDFVALREIGSSSCASVLPEVVSDGQTPSEDQGAILVSDDGGGWGSYFGFGRGRTGVPVEEPDPSPREEEDSSDGRGPSFHSEDSGSSGDAPDSMVAALVCTAICGFLWIIFLVLFMLKLGTVREFLVL